MAWKALLGITLVPAALAVAITTASAAPRTTPGTAQDPPAPQPAPAPAQETPVPAPGPAPVQEQPAPAPAPAETAPAKGYVAVTTADEVRLRAGPSVNYRVLERLPKGAWVVVTGEDGEYLRVQVPGGVPVFVKADLCEVGPDGKSVTISKSDVLMRPTAGQEYAPLEGQKLQKGDTCALLAKEKGESSDWLRVLPPAGVEVFVHKSLLEKASGEADRAAELKRIELERRDAYTGGKETEAARADAATREKAFAALTAGAAAALAAAPADSLPADADRQREGLTQVMTESGDPVLRAKAASVSRDYAQRERVAMVARAKADKASVAGELQKKLAAIDEQYRKRMDEILKAAPRSPGPKFHAIGTVQRETDGSFFLVKGGVTLHRIDSLRYDLDEMVGLRIGVNGTEVKVDPAKGIVIFRVDGLEILE